MKRIVLILAVTLIASLASPFATSAFAMEKDKDGGAKVEVKVCICPDGHVCTHTKAEYKKMLKVMAKTGECPDMAAM